MRAARRVKKTVANLALTLLINLVVIFGTGVVWYELGGHIAVVSPVTGALVAVSVGMLPLIRRRGQDGEDKPLWPPMMLLIVPAAVVIVALPSLALAAFLNSRPVDLTHEFELSPSGPFKEGRTVTAKAHTDRAGSRLFITFAASEHDENAPVCAQSSRLKVTLTSGAGHGGEQSGKPGEEFAFDLGHNHNDIRLAVRMTAEPNCVLDVSVASARTDD